MEKIPKFDVYKPVKKTGLKRQQKKIKHSKHYRIKSNLKLKDFIKRKILIRDGRTKTYAYEHRIYRDKRNNKIVRWYHLFFHWELGATAKTPFTILDDTYIIAGKKFIHQDIRALSLEVLRYSGYKILSDRENIQIIDSYDLTVWPWSSSYTVKKYMVKPKRKKKYAK